MQPKSARHLKDVQDSARFILEQTRTRTLDDYRRDRMFRQAIERNFEIIGEAVNRLHRLDPGTAQQIDHASQIVAFRNVLIHGYDLIEDDQVWQVIERHLPALLQQVERLLAEATPPAPGDGDSA